MPALGRLGGQPGAAQVGLRAGFVRAAEVDPDGVVGGVCAPRAHRGFAGRGAGVEAEPVVAGHPARQRRVQRGPPGPGRVFMQGPAQADVAQDPADLLRVPAVGGHDVHPPAGDGDLPGDRVRGRLRCGAAGSGLDEHRFGRPDNRAGTCLIGRRGAQIHGVPVEPDTCPRVLGEVYHSPAGRHLERMPEICHRLNPVLGYRRDRGAGGKCGQQRQRNSYRNGDGRSGPYRSPAKLPLDPRVHQAAPPGSKPVALSGSPRKRLSGRPISGRTPGAECEMPVRPGT